MPLLFVANIFRSALQFAHIIIAVPDGAHNLNSLSAQNPVVLKNIPSVNNQLKVIKHLVRVKPLKLPYGLPTEEDLSDTYLNSLGQLVIRKKLQPIDIKSTE
ncbi:unnamed protein product [Ranitomeya imitator]|uniref:Uncharacterized protein n=1 Tax=Ranitomeya imitator TaxID=111125 RepID=A0ABN9KXN0_9NEOB|nr:unnamed protein product [Ranitomeya imitator]